jgi:hypothetical protein
MKTMLQRHVALLKVFITITMLDLLALSAPLNAQQGMPLQKNLVSLELLGRAGIYSTNYEHYFRRRFGVGAGIAVWDWSRGEHTVIVPVYLSARPIGDKHSLYAGAGATLSRSNLTLFSSSRPYSNSVFGTASVGYQYRTAGGTIIRPTANLFFKRNSWIVWPGITIGHSF